MSARSLRATAIPARRLRVGYVSADLRSHPVASFIEPLVVAHDRTAVEVLCYSDGTPDAVTARIRRRCRWMERHPRPVRPGAGCGESTTDQIDVLVDLSRAHQRRPAALLRPPAGSRAGDLLRLPRDHGHRRHRVEAHRRPRRSPGVRGSPPRLSGCGASRAAFCVSFRTPLAGDVGALPAAADGHVTFGSFNNLAKVNEGVLAVWARILDALPTSRLVPQIPGAQRSAAGGPTAGFLHGAWHRSAPHRHRALCHDRRPLTWRCTARWTSALIPFLITAPRPPARRSGWASPWSR